MTPIQTGAMDTVDTVVQSLLRVHQGGPLADDQAHQGLLHTEEQAYAAQDCLLAALGASPGACPMHWKSGAPTRVDVSKHAPLPARGVRKSGSDVGDLRLGHRLFEAEVALRVGREVSPKEAQRIGLEDAWTLLDGMCVSIELLDSRWRGGREAPLLLKQADLLMHGALVLGDFVPFSARAWSQQDCRVRIGDAAVQTFRGSLGIGDPAWVLPAWMRHATRHGASMAAGTVVSTGTWCGVLEVPEGQAVTVEFPGIGTASLTL
ncbi:fumarylacetoacetate hydrolase family protein [Hydrogenophaga sp. BPS33]|uniref:fumarylacetoacetate hydrolase family protein n=1 Tax=Hydrogenophaga sp. BPS33 TaxID=2651974 RepID=UPI00131FB484|nr:fumarylacetoacetate hydrolase family protein [Hydrogenophaga sp. BPS33]QHE87268.1 fumarylacetoacetate hydrolase family protein [Hydrogenophaga sp. BPS33]